MTIMKIYYRLQSNVLRSDWWELPTARRLAKTQSDAISLLFDIHFSHTTRHVTTSPGKIDFSICIIAYYDRR